MLILGIIILLVAASTVLLVIDLILFCLENNHYEDREDIQYIKMLKEEEFNNN